MIAIFTRLTKAQKAFYRDSCFRWKWESRELFNSCARASNLACAVSFVIVVFASLLLFGKEALAQAQSQNYYYDPAGRLIVVVDPASGSATYNYDANGNILSVVRAPLTTVVAAQVSPSSAAVGATVTIYGTAFGTTANTSVSFNGKAAVVSAATSTTLTVTVPSGATSGQITVTAPGGSAKTLYNFTVLAAAPTVTSVPAGAIAQGSTFTVGGTGFDTNPAKNVVVINGMRAQVTAATATSLTVVAPVCVGLSKVQVETANGVAASAASVTMLPAGQTAANLQTTVSTSLGSAATLSFDGTGRAIMVTFSATQGQTMMAYFSAADSALSGGAVTALYAPDGSSFFYNNYGGQIVANTPFGPYPAQGTGVYTFWITPPAAAGSATLNFVNVPAAASAALTTSGTAVALTTATVGQQMQARFNATGGNNIAVQVVNPSNGQGTTNFGNASHYDYFYVSGPNGPIYATWMNYSHNFPGFFSGGLPLAANGTGTYTITMWPDFPHVGELDYAFYNVPAPASAALAANGTAKSLTTTVPGQTFSATFTGTAGQVISLDLLVQSGTLGSNHGDVVTITGPSGQLWTFSWWWAIGSEIFTGPLTLPSAGTYTITDVPDGMETGQLQFTLYTVPASAKAALTVGGSAVTLATTVPGQTFAPTFTGAANQRISVLMNVVSGTLGSEHGDTVTLTGPTGVVWTGSMAWSNNPTQLFSGVVTLPANGAGTYTISDAPYFTETGQLSFQVTQVPADVTGTISIGGSAVSLATTAPGQRMVLAFNGTAGQTISLLSNAFTGTLASAGGQVVILAPDGSTQAYSGSLCCGGSAYSNNINLTQTGTYTITLTPNSTSTGGATFQLYNEAALTSTLTPGGGSVGLTTSSPDQTINLTMPETAGHRVAVLVQLDPTLTAAGNSWVITAPDGSTQLYSFSGVNGSALWTGAMPLGSVSATTPTLTQTGNYTVSLTPLNLAEGAATFTAYDVPSDVTGTISVGHNASFALTTPGQGLRATYAGTANASATFAVTPTSVNPSSVCFNVTVLEPDGATSLNAGQACGGPYGTGSLTLPASGNYTIVAVPAAPATGTFTVGVTSP